jgi:nucleoside-diphosphate-sugar epimerase
LRVLVSGTSSVLGHYAAAGLEEGGCDVVRAARGPAFKVPDLRLDLTDERAVRAAARGLDAALLVPILTVSAGAARWLAEEGVRRIVVFSSNNVGIDQESPVYRALARAEKELAALDAEIVILRPTMIYGHRGDGNLSRLVRFAKTYGFLPCPGRGRALQQPVFVLDLARAAVQAVMGGYASGPFSIGGCDVVSTEGLFTAVLRAAGQSERRLVRIPLSPLRAAASAAEAAGLPAPLKRAQLARIEQDKIAAEAALYGFTPQVGLGEGLARLRADIEAAPRGKG